METKMSFMAENYAMGNIENKLAKTGYRFGIVRQPTGTGKSAVIFEDIINNIKNRHKKQIFIICSHILNLNEQTYNDLFEVNKYVNFMKDLKTCIFLNSSVDINRYIGMTFDSKTDIKKDIKDLEKFESSEYDIAFVSSCNDSFDKLWNIKFEKNVDVICYIDECHNLNKKVEKNLDKFTTFCKKCWKVYGLSATPSKFVNTLNTINNKINKQNKKYLASESCIVDMSAADAIKRNLIIKPYIKTIHTNDGLITPSVINDAMIDAINSDSCNIHKMLVTCFSIPEAQFLFDECTKLGYKCFKNTSDDNWVISDFCKEVEDCQENCIIFHCRKLIQGIDIKSITDAIISNNSNQDADREIRIIQIIGRAIRTAPGERGKNIEDRNKKFANIYFVSNGTPEYDDAIARIVIKYYGLNNLMMDDGSVPPERWPNPNPRIDGPTPSDDGPNIFKKYKIAIEELKINYKEYIEKEVLKFYNAVITDGGWIPIEVLMEQIDWGSLSDDNTTISMFDKEMQIKTITEVFNANGIELK